MNLKAIMVCQAKLNDEQLQHVIDRLESQRRLTTAEHNRLLLAHNAMTEREWQRKHRDA